MNAVTLSRKLVLEQPVVSPDGPGEFARHWQTLGEMWAEVVAVAARERDGGDVSVSSARYRITVRGAPFGTDARPTAEQRFREGARLFNIVAVTERDANGRYLICHKTEERAT